jgi:hypothetical protein
MGSENLNDRRGHVVKGSAGRLQRNELFGQPWLRDLLDIRPELPVACATAYVNSAEGRAQCFLSSTDFRQSVAEQRCGRDR